MVKKGIKVNEKGIILVAVIKDVAKLAGVSVGTVSKYLNTPELLREDKRAAVEDAIQKLNYNPNLFARNLRVQDSKTIAVIAQGIQKVCEYLISLGNTRIAYMGCRTKDQLRDPKLKGFMLTMEKHRLEPHSIVRLEKEYTMQTGYESAEQILKSGQLPDAILSNTDVMSIGVLNCLRNHGILAPDDIMLASFDNMEQAEYCNPRLTTLNVPIEAMSVKAVELLVAQMENRECKNTGNAFELELIIRETTKNR